MSSAGGRISASAGANLIGQNAQERNQEATCFVGNLEPECTEEIAWELFSQTGPVGMFDDDKQTKTQKVVAPPPITHRIEHTSLQKK